MEIKKCVSIEEVKSTYSVMCQLRSSYNLKTYTKKLTLMLKNGYHLLGGFKHEKCITVAGYRIRDILFFANGSELYIEDWVTDEAERGKGYGKSLFSELKNEAIKHNCQVISLDSGFQRKQAHAFYEHLGFNAFAKHFLLKL